MQTLTAFQVVYPPWYLFSQLFVCATASLIFWMLYKYSVPGTDSLSAPRREKGLLFIALATLIWALWPAVALSFGISGQLRIYFSTLNNVFLLLAAAFFDYGPRRLRFFQLHERWVWMVICAGLVIASITSNIEHLYWQRIPDVMLSIATLIVVGWAVCVTFYYRISREAALIAGVITVYVVYAQSLEIIYILDDVPQQQPTESHFIVNLTSKILMIMILLLAAISSLHEKWVEQVKEIDLERLPDNRIDIHLTGKRDSENNRRWIVKLKNSIDKSGAETAQEQLHGMTSKPHLLLLQFVLRQLADPDKNGGMMNTISDSYYHSDLTKIHKLLQLEVPALFKNNRRDGGYSMRDNIYIRLDEAELAKDPDVLAMMKKEKFIASQ